MENKFKKMYAVMGILGECLGIAGALYGIYKNIDTVNSFYIMLVALLVLLIAVRVLYILKLRGKAFAEISPVNAAIAKGHLSMMFGLSVIITAFMFANEQSIDTVLIIVLIIMLFMAVMMNFMIKTFTKIMDMTKESESKEDND